MAATDATSLRELIQEVVREELQLLTATKTVSAVAVRDVVRYELRHALSTPQAPHEPYRASHTAAAYFPYHEPSHISYLNAIPETYKKPGAMSYEEVVRRPPPSSEVLGIQEIGLS